MKFLELAKKRYSVRSYKPDPVEDKKLQQVLEAANLAPTAANVQAFRLIVVHTAGRQAELKRIYARPWFVEAPIVICICGIKDEGWVRRGDGHNYTELDAGIVMDHLILEATELGLGTCWIAAFDPVAAREVLGLPPEAEPLIFTPLGYPNDTPGPKERNTLDEIVKYERW